MNIYKTDTSALYFLNGTNIQHELTADGKLNPIPSLSLLNKVNSDINGKIDSSLKNLSVNNTITIGEIVSSLSEKDGKIEYQTSPIMSSYIVGLPQYVKNEIKLSVEELKYEDTAVDKEFVFKVGQGNGVIDVERRQLSSSDIYDWKNRISSDFQDFRYDPSTGLIHIKISNNDRTISASQLISQTVVSDIHVRTDEITGEKWLVIKYKTSESGEYREVEIKLTDIFQLYLSSDSISIAKNNQLAVTDIIPRKSELIVENSQLSNSTDRISSIKTDANGKLIYTIETFTKDNIDNFDNDVNSLIDTKVGTLNSFGSVSAENRLIYAVKEHNGVVSAYYRALVSSDFNDGNLPLSPTNRGNQLNQFQIANLPEDIDTINSNINVLSTDIDSLEIQSVKNMKLNGHVVINGTEKYLSSLLYGTWCVDNKILNGSTIEVKFEESYPISVSYKTKDNFILGDGDFIIIHEHLENKQWVPLNEINHNNVIILKSGLSKYDLSAVPPKMRVFVKDVQSELSSYRIGKYVDELSVEKIFRNDYEQRVIEGQLCSNCIYVISSDYMDAYGQVLSNLAMSLDDSMDEYIGVAATKEYVDSFTNKNKQNIDELSTKLTTIKSSIITTLSDLNINSDLSAVVEAVITIRNILSSI